MIQLGRYKIAAGTAVLLLALYVFDPGLGLKAVSVVGFSLKEMAAIIPPIFVLLGLLDVWVPRETMVRYMGEKSGIPGIALSILIGSAAAGPLYGAFPVAAVFMKKGVKFSNILIFIGAWSTTKIPMLLFEASSLGVPFALTRLLVGIPGIVIIAHILVKITRPEDIREMYAKVETM